LLKIADPNKDFLVCKDSWKEGIRRVLMQEGHAIYYESIKLNEHEINYVTCDLELAAIVHALKMWRHYLLGRKIVLMTDQSGCWSRLFTRSLGNRARTDRATFWLRSSVRAKQFKHVRESTRKRQKVVRILGHFVHIVTGLALS
jgi:hypothetical protein